MMFVDPNGSGDARTIREALDLVALRDAERGVKPGGAAPEPVTIRLAAGTYRERVEIRRPRLTLVGGGCEFTRVVGGLGAKMPAGDGTLLGTFRTYTMLVDADDVTLRDLTVENDAGDGREVGQAIALYADGDRLRVLDCALLGHQDTLFAGPLPPREIQSGGFIGPKQFSPRRVGRQYYRGCLIAGDVDFIFGGGRCYFERCEIRSLSRDDDPNGYVTAASTPESEPCGFVFSSCRLTNEGCADGTVFLGRPWRDWAQVAFVNCELGAHIKPGGWFDWNKPHAREVARYVGAGLAGPGAEGAAWPEWTELLGVEAESDYSRERVLAGEDGWDPEARDA